MNREQARKIVEMFEFIKAYAEGKEIEVNMKTNIATHDDKH